MDTIKDYHDNYDVVLKSVMSLYTNKSLNFLGIDATVTELLSGESVEVDIRKTLDDQVLKLDNKSGLDVEWEASVSLDDALRFAAYNIGLTRKYKIPFKTIIMTRKKVRKKIYISGSIKFTPVIIVLSDRDGKAALDNIKQNLSQGIPVNELEVVYLPLYNNRGKSFEDIFQEIIKLLPQITSDKQEQDRLLTLSALLVNKFVPADEYKTILEAIKMAFEDNTMFKILEENGAIKKAREMAKKFLELGVSLEIVKAGSGLSDSELLEIQQGISQTVANS